MAEDKDVLGKMVREAIAAEVVVNLDGGVKDTVLKRAVADVIAGATFSYEMNQQIAKRAAELARVELEKGGYDEALTAAFKAGFDKAVKALPAAFSEMLVQAIAGKDGGGSSYGHSPGLLLTFMRKAMGGS